MAAVKNSATVGAFVMLGVDGVSILRQFFSRKVLGKNQSIMSFVANGDLLVRQFELKKRDHIFTHELRGNGATDKERKLLGAQCHVLFDLNDAQMVSTSFSLHGAVRIGHPVDLRPRKARPSLRLPFRRPKS